MSNVFLMCAWLCGASFGATPIEDRGLRLSGCRLGGSFGLPPIEDRGFRLPGCLPDVASEVHLEGPLSRIVAFGPPDVASEAHLG